MLTAHRLSKFFGIQPVLKKITFSINPRERVGLVGPNGSGKTTLLRILAGEEQPDEGHVVTPGDLRLGYLSQAFDVPPGATLGDVVGRAAGDAERLEAELARLGQALALEPLRDELQQAYDRTLQRLSSLAPGRAPAILDSLGLGHLPREQSIDALSGGQKTRLALALVLLDDPDLLLLDEPTNHLDIAMLEWLEAWLADFPGGALIVSHDRTFLDRTVTKILALDPHTHTVQEYAGNYTSYAEQVRHEREKQWAAYRDQQDEVRKMKQDIARVKQQAQQTEASTTSDQMRRYAKKVARKATSREKKLERYLHSDERVEKPKRSWKMKVEFEEPEYIGRDVLSLDQLSVGYPGHPPLLTDVTLNLQAGRRVVLTGPNGCGKTTLLQTIAGELRPLSGHLRLGSTVKVGYMTQEQTGLDDDRSALQLLQQTVPYDETEARSFLHYFLFSDDEPLRPSAELSFGERARLALALLVAQGCNFLLLDEPLNYLDIPSRSRFEEALQPFEGTVLAVVHDRTFIDAFATDLWQVENGSVRHCLP